MSERVFLVRVSFLVPVAASTESEAYEIRECDRELNDAFMLAQEMDHLEVDIERELTSDDVDPKIGADDLVEAWAHKIPYNMKNPYDDRSIADILNGEVVT